MQQSLKVVGYFVIEHKQVVVPLVWLEPSMLDTDPPVTRLKMFPMSAALLK